MNDQPYLVQEKGHSTSNTLIKGRPMRLTKDWKNYSDNFHVCTGWVVWDEILQRVNKTGLPMSTAPWKHYLVIVAYSEDLQLFAPKISWTNKKSRCATVCNIIRKIGTCKYSCNELWQKPGNCNFVSI